MQDPPTACCPWISKPANPGSFQSPVDHVRLWANTLRIHVPTGSRGCCPSHDILCKLSHAGWLPNNAVSAFDATDDAEDTDALISIVNIALNATHKHLILQAASEELASDLNDCGVEKLEILAGVLATVLEYCPPAVRAMADGIIKNCLEKEGDDDK